MSGPAISREPSNTWAVVTVVLLLVGSEVAMLWVIFTQEAAAVLFLWLPILFLVAVWRDLGRTTWERLKTGRLS